MRIGDFELGKERPFFIADLSTNFRGDIVLAREMIFELIINQCDAVKIQMWDKESLFSKEYYQNNETLIKYLDMVSLNEEEIKALHRHAGSGIMFSGSVFCKKDVDLLVELKAPFIKIASMDNNNIPLITYAVSKRIPLILSLGLTEDPYKIIEDVELVCQAYDTEVSFLYCVSEYPTPRHRHQLGLFRELQDYFNHTSDIKRPLGISIHSSESRVYYAAAALGAEIIEFHYTGKRRPPMRDLGKGNYEQYDNEDFDFSLTERNFKYIKTQCEIISEFLPIIKFEEYEKEQLEDQQRSFRRSIVSSRDIKIGETIKKGDLDYKRPGVGYPIEKTMEIVGKKAIKDIPRDTILRKEMLEL